MYIDIHTHHANCKGAICIRNKIIKETTIIKTVVKQFYSLGIHPWYLPNNIDHSIQLLEKHLLDKQVLALGEIGLDFHHNILSKSDKKRQIAVFIAQLSLAKQYRKPIIIHCVKAWDTLLKIKKQYPTNTAWIVHGYTKNKDLANQLIKAGFYLSFGAGIINNRLTAEAIKKVPLNKIFFETDDQLDYDIEKIYHKAGELLQLPVPILAQQISDNFRKIMR